jgi:AraC-like DNA-binding protein
MTMVTSASRPPKSSGNDDVVRAQAVAKVVGEMKKLTNSCVLLDEWAEFVSLNKYELIAAFKRLTGIPPIAFHNAEKLEIAKRLLVFEQISVTEVCFELGFQSVGSFVSKFTNCVGVSPGGYARVMGETGFASILVGALQKSKRARNSGSGIRIRFELPVSQRALSLIAAVFPRPFPSGYPTEWRFVPPFCRVTTIGDGLTGYCLAASFPVLPRLAELVNFRPALIGRQALDITDIDVRIELRTPTIFDPPITLAVPALFSRYASHQ